MRADYVDVVARKGGPMVTFYHSNTTGSNTYTVSHWRYHQLAKLCFDLAREGKLEIRPWVVTDRVGWTAKPRRTK